VVLVFLNMIPLLMLTTIKTGVLFVFSGVSIPLLLHAVLTQKSRYYIANLGEEK
jgi:mannose/fructose-specific phosphotransferase system component IIA